MFSTWFNVSPIIKVGFDDLKNAIKYPDTHIIINTLLIDNQECLIKNTISIDIEERMINDILQKSSYKDKRLIIYGKNATDTSVDRKYHQLISLGFSDILIYSGGLFEWVLLQDIYGEEEFPTTKKVIDILKYKPLKI